MRQRRITATLATALLAVALPAAPSASATLDDAVADAKDGKYLFESTCNVCHGLERALAKSLTAEEWLPIFSRMKDNGAEFDSEGRALMISHLITGKLFEVKCSACHGTDRPLSKSRSAQAWLDTVKRMAAKRPGHLTDEQILAIAAYLGAVRPPQ